MTYSLRDFGSYTVGGRLHEVTEGTPREIAFTRSASFTYDPRGHFAVEQTYVQYFVPERRRDVPPMVLVHGGGMHGSTWETTPDGRPGWLHHLLDRGFEVHVVDLVERGRSGFAPGVWLDAPILRSAEEAWSLFRFGAPEDFPLRRAYPGLQFPIEYFDGFLQRIVPRWLSTALQQTDGLVAVLDRLGEASLICHSQGAEIGFDACARCAASVQGVLAVEPSAFPGGDIGCPVVILAGDNLDSAQHWADRSVIWEASITSLKERGGQGTFIPTARDIAPGGSHFLMMDHHMADVLEAGLHALQG